jgi:hypothetical protein
MKRNGRVVMHAHLQNVLTNLIGEALSSVPRHRSAPALPVDLLAAHIAATFVLVLNWWVDNEAPLTPAEVDVCFRALVTPILTAL